MEQHGFFVQGVEKKPPRPRFTLNVILIIEKAIIYAWKKLKENPPDNFDLLSAKEDNITVELQNNLENLRGTEEVKGFNAKTFETVNRSANFKNYNGKKINKQPDLIIKLVGIVPSLDYGMFIECKPVDKNNHSIKRNYCDKGITRFVNGNYAWAMPFAMMIGYIRGNYNFLKLYNTLNKHKELYNIKELSLPPKEAEKIYITKHKRDWIYLETKEKAGDITIRHLWLVIL